MQQTTPSLSQIVSFVLTTFLPGSRNSVDLTNSGSMFTFCFHDERTAISEINQASLFQASCLLRLREFLRKPRTQFPARQQRPQQRVRRSLSQWRAQRTLTVMCAQTNLTVTPAKTKQKTTKFLPVKQGPGSVTLGEAVRVSHQPCLQSHF